MTPVLAFVGPSGSGKTRVITRLLPMLRQRGLSVGVVKRCHHRGLIVDQPGKDSWRHWHAGAATVALVSPDLVAVHRRVGSRKSLSQMVRALGNGLDLILAEGFQEARVPRIQPPFPRTRAGLRLLATDISRLAMESRE